MGKGKDAEGQAGGARLSRSHVEELLDEALAETFPASDPVAIQHEDEPEDAGTAGDKGKPA